MSTKKELYRSRKAKGLCVKCGKVPPRENRVMCAECAEKVELFAVALGYALFVRKTSCLETNAIAQSVERKTMLEISINLTSLGILTQLIINGKQRDCVLSVEKDLRYLEECHVVIV